MSTSCIHLNWFYFAFSLLPAVFTCELLAQAADAQRQQLGSVPCWLPEPRQKEVQPPSAPAVQIADD